ncbi:hypothetical protein STRAU_1634 [Streptomyces aurantiacus JA 4570]|uniref:Uncharacterized protein n=1 Tax=Streptomyces aurantiacus JA 4570 TaxID=1286094 RepID=S3ZP50_9ACTN|nr:hypothetical protein STRAU_1634 [Streptomyces aurantiacus JA 4570]
MTTLPAPSPCAARPRALGGRLRRHYDNLRSLDTCS